MLKTVRAACAVGIVFLASPNAGAQEEFARSGQFAVSAERLFGVTHSSTTREDPDTNAESTLSYTTINLLTSPFSSATTNYSFPRVGGDYFVTDGFSIGAALGFFTTSGKIESENLDDDTGNATGFLLAPRVGYAYMFNPTVGIWPRLGITYQSVHSEDDTGDTEIDGNLLALTVEAALAISPTPHVAFLIGPTFDVGLSGGQETSMPPLGSSERDVTGTDIGLQAGLLAYF